MSLSGRPYTAGYRAGPMALIRVATTAPMRLPTTVGMIYARRHRNSDDTATDGGQK